MPPDDRWHYTRTFARLGVIAGTVMGVALALHVGGQDGSVLPLASLLSMPTGFLLTLVPGVDIASAGPASEWSQSHLAFCASIAANWTLFGALADRLGAPRTATAPAQVTSAATAALDDPRGDLRDDLLLVQFQQLERSAARATARAR